LGKPRLRRASPNREFFFPCDTHTSPSYQHPVLAEMIMVVPQSTANSIENRFY
jgi:hypothetical protein